MHSHTCLIMNTIIECAMLLNTNGHSAAVLMITDEYSNSTYLFQYRLTQNGTVAITKEPMLHLAWLETGALLGSSLVASSSLPVWSSSQCNSTIIVYQATVTTMAVTVTVTIRCPSFRSIINSLLLLSGTWL